MGAGILLLGAGGHARACIDVIEQHRGFAIVGAIGTLPEVGARILGYRVLGTDADLARVRDEHAIAAAIVAVGQIKTAAPRIRLFAVLEAMGIATPVIVSPRAYVSPHAEIGAGTIVMHGTVVNAGARVGRGCILNSHAVVEHDVEIGDHCHVASNAAINGGVKVGSGTFVGSGTSVREGVVIGAGSVIGMGQRVLADCAPGARVRAEPTER